MDTPLTDTTEEPLSETPEDVAILYSWANLHGAKYRDFSASRREYRAQVRHRAAEELRESELKAKAEAEAAATDAERIAREAERAARSLHSQDNGIDRDRALRDAEEAARRAGAERVEAARRAEAAALAEAAARREEREIAEAHASAQRQAARWEESEVRRRSAAGPQPSRIVPGLASDPYVIQQGAGPEVEMASPNRQLEYTQPSRFRDEYGNRASGERRPYQPEPEPRRRPQGYRPDEASGVLAAYRATSATESAPVRARGTLDDYARATSGYSSAGYSPKSSPAQSSNGNSDRMQHPAHSSTQSRPDLYSREVQQRTPERGQDAPAWLSAGSPAQGTPPSPVADTLQYSRERVAARWFALKGVFEPGQQPAVAGPGRQRESRTPVLAVFSLAGGVGKTSLVATLGRALSSAGEKLLLADTTSHGLLPYYFGASELRPGVVRTFSPPNGSTDAPISLVSYDVEHRSGDRSSQEQLIEELNRSGSASNRVMLDLNANSAWILRRLSRMSPTVLIPVAPDMNSVISLQSVEKFFQGATDADGHLLQPFYVLNQFDTSLPLHLDVREVLRRQLGDRLLPFVIRRAPAVSEALAEGMTVVDYAPETAIAEDYRNIANWLRGLSTPVSHAFRPARWSEQ